MNSGIIKCYSILLILLKKGDIFTLLAIGVVDAYNERGSLTTSFDSYPDEEELILPGMQRHLYLKRTGSAEMNQSTVRDGGEGRGDGGDGGGGDDESPSLLMNKPGSSEQSSFDAGTEGKKKQPSKQ